MSMFPSAPPQPQQQQQQQPLQKQQQFQPNPCVAGYLLKQSHVDPHVWRKVHCVLTEDYFWYVTRISRKKAQQHCHSNDQHFEDHDLVEMQDDVFSIPIGKRHGRIRLEHALLLEPPLLESNNHKNESGRDGHSIHHHHHYSLYRIPNSFEIVSAKGTSHIFRATSRRLQSHWIKAIAERIEERQENSLMEHAEMIVADESKARTKRFHSVSVQPFWEQLLPMPKDTTTTTRTTLATSNDKNNENARNRSALATTVDSDKRDTMETVSAVVSQSTDNMQQDWKMEDRTGSDNNTTPFDNLAISNQREPVLNPDMDGPLNMVLRLGLQVAEYRERCRHVQAMLPAKKPIVVITASPRTPQRESSIDSIGSASSSTHIAPESLDQDMQEMVQATWDAAASLLAQSTQIAMDIQAAVAEATRSMNNPTTGTDSSHQNSNNNNNSSSSRLKEGKFMSRSLETLCRHVDYVITGKFRQLSEGGFVKTPPPEQGNGLKGNCFNHRSARDRSQDPPPMDLFDLLLTEFQNAAIALAKSK